MTDPNHTNIPESGGKAPALWGWHTLLSLGITIAVFIVLAAYVDIQHLCQELNASNKWLLLLAGLSHYATYPVRGMRWKYSMRHLPVCCSKARFGLLVFSTISLTTWSLPNWAIFMPVTWPGSTAESGAHPPSDRSFFSAPWMPGWYSDWQRWHPGTYLRDRCRHWLPGH